MYNKILASILCICSLSIVGGVEEEGLKNVIQEFSSLIKAHYALPTVVIPKSQQGKLRLDDVQSIMKDMLEKDKISLSQMIGEEPFVVALVEKGPALRSWRATIKINPKTEGDPKVDVDYVRDEFPFEIGKKKK